jgi:hypothetical protein
LSRFLTLDRLSLRNKVVLLRADLNVPMKDGIVTDATRLERLMPTLKELKKANAKIVILSHLGRPQGKWERKKIGEGKGAGKRAEKESFVSVTFYYVESLIISFSLQFLVCLVTNRNSRVLSCFFPNFLEKGILHENVSSFYRRPPRKRRFCFGCPRKCYFRAFRLL